MLDCTGALIGEQYGIHSCYRERVPTVVVFEILPSHVIGFNPNLVRVLVSSLYNSSGDIFSPYSALSSFRI